MKRKNGKATEDNKKSKVQGLCWKPERRITVQWANQGRAERSGEDQPTTRSKRWRGGRRKGMQVKKEEKN